MTDNNEMKLNRLYRSKKNGRVYECFYYSEYSGHYSIKPLKPTETEKRLCPFPHLKIEYKPEDWILLPQNYDPEKDDTPATVDEIEDIGGVYLVKNNPL